MHKIFIDGSAGTTGLRIEQRLRGRTDLMLLTLPAAQRKDPAARAELLNAADAAILCLPDAAAREAVAMVQNDRTVLLDASTAHRTAPGWAYGFPELGPEYRENIQKSRRIAVPGCHATGFLALAKPLVAAGLLEPQIPLHCFSVTGYTGGGKAMIAEYEAPGRTRNDHFRSPGDPLRSPRQYALEQTHKHLPEMTAVAGLRTPPVFCPIVADFPRGMEVTIPLHQSQLSQNTAKKDLLQCYMTYYYKEPLVRVNPEACAAPPNAYEGRDSLEITVAGNEERLLLIARLDNLGKGASGAAVQCLNLALGAEETEGLIG